MNKTTFITLLCLLLGISDLVAQRTHAVSGGIGTIYYYGDLTDRFKSAELKPAASLMYHRYIQQQLSLRVGLMYGQIGAEDWKADSESRRARNLHFRSPIFEVSAVMVYEIFKDKHFGNAWVARPFITPYLFAGVSMFHFNPQARYNGSWIDLQPLGTEGQQLPSSGTGPYSRVQVAIPGGLGLSLRIADYAGINMELGYRLTRTDYLDDVSTDYPDLNELAEYNPTAAELSYRPYKGVSYEDYINEYGSVRGNPDAKDGYFFFNLSVVYYLSKFASRD